MPNPNRSTAAAEKNHNKQPKETTTGGSKETESTAPASNNLWVGNLTIDTTESDLMTLFGRFGALDSVTNYSSRNYAFIHYRRPEDARAAKDGLQNSLLRGNSIRIEFARPAKPAKNVWVGGISSSVTKEQLEDELLKCGKIENFKFLRDRNSALVEFYKLEDAVAAVKNMNGKRLGSEQIRVDYLRSQPSRRDNWSEFHDSRDGNFNNRNSGPPDARWASPDGFRNSPESSQFGHKKHQHLGGRKEGQPSKVLWVGYPPSAEIDEQALHNAMILFGEIERIKGFPSRHYAFVEFRSVDEARRAKEGLQGRLFNDPRINIMFSSSELAPPKDGPGFFPGVKGPRPDMFYNDLPFGPGPIDLYGPSRPMAPNSFPGLIGHNGMPGPNMLMRPFGPQGGFDHVLSNPEVLNEVVGFLHSFQDGNFNNPMGQNWRMPSPAPAMLPSPGPGGLPMPPTRPAPGWDGSEVKGFQRESKRSRIDGPPIDDVPFHPRMMDDQRPGDQQFGFDQQLDRGASASGVLSQSPLVPPGRDPHGQVYPDNDFCWRGIIAKGGSPVCRARCVPIGKGLDTQLPEIVNCSARTGLDMLAKHYAEASGFDIVFFLPDSEDDFASYTEFLHYLGAKNRAGVAKFDDGTTLFLVPPSDFLTKVLNVSGRERLYGVVLKLSQQKPSLPIHQQQSIPSSHVVDRRQLPPSRTDYSLLPAKDDQAQMGRVSHEGAVPYLSNPTLITNEEPPLAGSAPEDHASNPAPVTQSGLSLTPELIATLTKLASSVKSSSSASAQMPLGTPSLETNAYPTSVVPDNPMASQGWRQGHQANFPSAPSHSMQEQAVNSSQQSGYQYNNQAPFTSHFPAYRSDNSGQTFAQNVAQQDVASSRQANNFTTPSGGQFTAPPHPNQLSHPDAALEPQKSYGAGNVDANGLFQSQVFHQPKPSNATSTQIQGMHLPHSQVGMASTNDNTNTVLPDQVQRLQSALSGVTQGTAEGEADKNQRYQTTLQFAANLLLQIQQQQQGKNQAAKGPGNHH